MYLVRGSVSHRRTATGSRKTSNHRKHLSLGGHVESTQDVLTRARRKVHEESGPTATDQTLSGTVPWPGFGAKRPDYLCFVSALTSSAVRRTTATTMPRCNGCRSTTLPAARGETATARRIRSAGCGPAAPPCYPAGRAVIPSRWTRRVATSTANSTYHRRSKTVSTVKKSTPGRRHRPGFAGTAAGSPPTASAPGLIPAPVEDGPHRAGTDSKAQPTQLAVDTP